MSKDISKMMQEYVSKQMSGSQKENKNKDKTEPKPDDSKKEGVNIHIHMDNTPLPALGLGAMTEKKKGLMLKEKKDGNKRDS